MWFIVVLFSIRIWAADPSVAAIDQAQDLTLKKNRQQASAVLVKAIDAASGQPRVRAKMAEALNRIAQVFFTDKGQKLYEAGQSTMFETPDVALSQFREALALEDGNILVLDSIARLQLAKQDCDGAQTTLLQARTLAPYAPEPAILELKALICQQKFETFREKVKSLPAMDKSQEYIVQYLSAQDLLQQKLWRKAHDLLVRLNEADTKFPEVYYFLIKAGAELGRDTENYAAKYVSLCKALTPRDRKHYALEPALCLNLKEVEDELVKKENEI